VREISPPIIMLNSIVIEPSCSIWDTDVKVDEPSSQECVRNYASSRQEQEHCILFRVIPTTAL